MTEILQQIIQVLDQIVGWFVGPSFLPKSDSSLMRWIVAPGAFLLVVVMILELIFPYKEHHFGKDNFLNLTYFFVGMKITIWAAFFVPWMESAWVTNNLPTLNLDLVLNPFVFMALSILVVAFVDYWSHRWLHMGPLWHIHKIHHAPEKLNWAVLFHENFLMGTVSVPLYTAVGLLLGTHLVAPWGIFHLFVSYLQHANIRPRFGWLNYVIATPEIHRYHHANDPTYYNTNFAGGFVVWDMVFGTFHYDRDNPATEFGINEEISGNFFRQQAEPVYWFFRDVWRRLRPGSESAT